jgi:hypothetical protein
MKASKLSVLVTLASTAAVLASGGARADTVNVTVTAQIIGICKFTSGQTPVVTIANTGATIDPSLAGPANGSANVTYQCTNGQAPTFTVPTPATITCTTAGTCAATTMAPVMSFTSGGNGAGFSGGVKTLVVSGQLTAAQYANMQVGTYSGTEVVTVTP